MKHFCFLGLALLALNNPLRAEEQLSAVDVLAMATLNPTIVFEQPGGLRISLRPSQSIAVFAGPEGGPEWYANIRVNEGHDFKIFDETSITTIAPEDIFDLKISQTPLEAPAADRLARILGKPLTISALSRQAVFLAPHIIEFANGELAQWYLSRDGMEVLVSMAQNEEPIRVNLLNLLRECGAVCAQP